MAINPVGTWADPRHDLQTGTAYKIQLDNSIVAGKRVTDRFAPHAKTAPDMNVQFDTGYVFNDQVINEAGVQTISAGSAPAANPRIDRYVIDRLNGAITRIAGTEAASPVAPAIPEEKDPCASVLMVVGMTAVTNQDITDERLGGGGGGGVLIKKKSGANQTVTGSTAETIISAATQAIAGGLLGTDNWMDFFIDISDLDLFVSVVLRAKYDGTTFASLALAPLNICTGTSNQTALLWIRLRNDGVSNAQRGFMVAFISDDLVFSGSSKGMSSGTAAVDSTITKSFTFTVQLGNTSEAITVSGQQGIKYS